MVLRNVIPFGLLRDRNQTVLELWLFDFLPVARVLDLVELGNSLVEINEVLRPVVNDSFLLMQNYVVVLGGNL